MRNLTFIGLLPLLFACKDPADTAADTDTSLDTASAPEDSGVEALCGYIDVAMIYVPPGSFLMGSPTTEPGRGEDEEQHEVTLTRGFCVSQYEVMQRTFEEYANYNNSSTARCNAESEDGSGSCPVNQVDWDEAAWFTNVLSTYYELESCYDCDSNRCRTRVDPYKCDGFRLPTEAEWEYAARAGMATSFPNGADLTAGSEELCDGDLGLSNGTRLDDLGWYCGNSEGYPHAVSQHIRNPLYLYDIVGNVYEWTHDWYSEVYTPNAVDPVGPSTGSWRILRGGSFDSAPRDVRLAARKPAPPDADGQRNGFRIVRGWDR